MRNERQRPVTGKKDILMRAALTAAFIGSVSVPSVAAKSSDKIEVSATQIFRDLDTQLKPNENLIVDFSSIETVLPESVKKPKPVVKASSSNWKLDPEISWYGPGFYGKRTACGLELTKKLEGVANRDLPCGTLVVFEWDGLTRTFPVVDRGPYVDGRIFDLTGGACMSFKTKDHPQDRCFTGPINYRIEK
nr:hypothetical protein [Candidatus Levybacteria bacterium]